MPADTNWYILPLEAGLYGIEHNPVLTLCANTEQEFFDIAGIPLLAYFPMKLMGSL